MKHLQAAGFSVETEFREDLDAVADQHHVPAALRTCHTATVRGYVIEGHVPASVIEHLLARRQPQIAGIGVAGMPPGSPGMESPQPTPFDVVAWRPSGATFVYARVEADGTVRYY